MTCPLPPICHSKHRIHGFCRIAKRSEYHPERCRGMCSINKSGHNSWETAHHMRRAQFIDKTTVQELPKRCRVAGKCYLHKVGGGIVFIVRVTSLGGASGSAHVWRQWKLICVARRQRADQSESEAGCQSRGVRAPCRTRESPPCQAVGSTELWRSPRAHPKRSL